MIIIQDLVVFVLYYLQTGICSWYIQYFT